MAEQKVKIFSHCCIEGYTSIAMLKSSLDCEVIYETCPSNGWMDSLKKTLEKEKTNVQKPFIFITDLNIPESRKNEPEVQKLLNMINKRGNIILIDHHESGSWLMEDERIKAYVDPKSDSASQLVLNTLKANVIGEQERQELKYNNYLQFSDELKNTLCTCHEELNLFNNIVSIMNDIDSGRKKHDHIKYVFNCNKKRYIEKLVQDYDIILTNDKKKAYKKFQQRKEEAFKQRVQQMQVKVDRDKFNRKYAIVKEYGIPVNEIVDKVKEVLEDIKYVEIITKVKKNNKQERNCNEDLMIRVCVRSCDAEQVSAVEIASQYGGGGHPNAAGYSTGISSKNLNKLLEGSKTIDEIRLALRPFDKSFSDSNKFSEVKRRDSYDRYKFDTPNVQAEPKRNLRDIEMSFEF